MLLSLRTLLAFEDNIFDIEQHRQLERTIPNHEPATETLARIRNVIHDPNLNVPGRNGQQEELDPNIVAEYLDYQMTKEYQEQFENFCLSSDKYLAEVASIHQIISNVLGEPARISRECRFRCYDLIQNFQHITNRYENTNPFITFPQINQTIPNTTPTQNTHQNIHQNTHNENQQEIIQLPQKNEHNDKIESEKNTTESAHSSIRDVASIVAVMIVIVLLFLNYRNGNFNNIKIDTTEIAKNIDEPKNEKDENQSPTPQPPLANNTDNFEPEITPDPPHTLTHSPTFHESKQNEIRTVSALTDELNTDNITVAAERKKETPHIHDAFTESKIPPAQPLLLPTAAANNTNNPQPESPPESLPETQLDPFNTPSPIPETLPSTDSIFNASATSSASPLVASSLTASSNESADNQLPLPEELALPRNVNETEIKFREEQNPDKLPLNSSVWKTSEPNSDRTTLNEIERENYNRNVNSLILPAGGIDGITSSKIIQVNNDHDKNKIPTAENHDGISVTKKTGVLGTVVLTGDPMVIFTADSSESQWRFESNQFDIFANQYILTSAPFRADIKLGDDFNIEVIGDSKLSVLPVSNGVAAMYVDYGRLVIRACYNERTAMKQVKSIRIITERGECTVGFNGSKSVVFVDTFAEVSRDVAQSGLPAANNAANNTVANNTANNAAVSEVQIGTNPILGLLPDPSESISWLSAKQNVPSVTKNDISIVLTEGRTDRGIIKSHPNWLRRISVPAEGKQIETACLNIFNQKDTNIESALQSLRNDKSEIVRSFAYRLWGDLGRFDVPLKGRILETESIQQSLIQYFKEVMKRDAESVHRLTDAIEKERTK
ncbi:MAG: hypothetical protein LBL39_06240 [Planctomycetaceae bacterium]|jgi:hypothetical protein|nr:hypothetical protein [Planctomycetaceae bacterium]